MNEIIKKVVEKGYLKNCTDDLLNEIIDNIKQDDVIFELKNDTEKLKYIKKYQRNYIL